MGQEEELKDRPDLHVAVAEQNPDKILKATNKNRTVCRVQYLR